MRPLLAIALSFSAAACGSVQRWQELQTAPVTQAEVYDAVEYLARTDGYAPSSPDCDRGLGTWVSRWRYRQVGLNRPGRFRLCAEIMLDEEREDGGWTVRYLVQQQCVKDLERSYDPREEDWSDDGQDGEREYLFGERLRRRLQPPDEAAPLPGTPDRPR
jgi:hypothetical protein